MPFVSEVILLFKTAREAFSSIDGPPSVNEMVLLCETLLNTFLPVRFVVTDTGCASGVFLSNDAYQRSHATTFDRMLAPLVTYNPSITVFEGAHSADQKKWSSKLINQSIIQVTKRGAHKFILHVVKDTWTFRLKNNKTFYSWVTPLLSDHSRGSGVQTPSRSSCVSLLEK